jgi:UTP:GlnB (protein PII) uridylyltransferase
MKTRQAPESVGCGPQFVLDLVVKRAHQAAILSMTLMAPIEKIDNGCGVSGRRLWPGRLAPYSDLDILFLSTHGPQTRRLVEQILRFLGTQG